MKNKHLVLLFLATFAAGLLLRRFPPRSKLPFQRQIVRTDTADTRQIILQNPVSGETLVFDRLETGDWAVTLGNKTLPVPPGRMRVFLSEISSLKSRGVAKNASADLQEFGLGESRALQVRTVSQAGKTESFWLGKCRPGEGFSHLRLPEAPEVFEVEGQISCALRLRFEDLRSRKIADLDRAAVQSLTFSWARFPPLFYAKKEADWQTPGNGFRRSPEEMGQFFTALADLPLLGYADDFDDSRRRELFFGQISLHFAGEPKPLVLECFRSEKPMPQFVLLSSQNPKNYFYTADTLVAKLFFEPLKWGPPILEIPREDAL